MLPKREREVFGKEEEDREKGKTLLRGTLMGRGSVWGNIRDSRQ